MQSPVVKKRPPAPMKTLDPDNVFQSPKVFKISKEMIQQQRFKISIDFNDSAANGKHMGQGLNGER